MVFNKQIAKACAVGSTQDGKSAFRVINLLEDSAIVSACGADPTLALLETVLGFYAPHPGSSFFP